MTITLNIQNKQLFNKIVRLLSCFKNDGLKITTQNSDTLLRESVVRINDES